MSLDVVGSVAINVDLIVIRNCEISHKLTKEYVKTPVVIPRRLASTIIAVPNLQATSWVSKL